MKPFSKIKKSHQPATAVKAGKGLQELQRNWEGYAQTDPLWAICVDPEKKGNRWDLADFFLSGEKEISTLFAYLQPLPLSVDFNGPALDFGCGVGRLTQALARRFDTTYGVDISPTMIALADGYNNHPETCKYVLNDSDKLSLFDDNAFAFIYSSIVLQHIEPAYAKIYLQELIRLLQPGGLFIFQIVDRLVPRMMRIRKKLRLKVRLYRLADRLGLMSYKTDPYHMAMHCIPEKAIRAVVESAGAEIIDVQLTNSAEVGTHGNLCYLESEPRVGYISKQYTVRKFDAGLTHQRQPATTEF